MRKRTSAPIPSKDELRNLITYDKQSGKVFWLPRPENRWQDKGWNTKFANKEVSGSPNTEYIWISIHNMNYLLHRVIVVYESGIDAEVVDHKDLNKKNNAWDNLRIANQSQNRCNAPIGAKLGKSGVKGLSQTKQGQWKGRVTFKGQHYNTARYDLKEDAVKALEALRISIHGEFSRHN